MDFDVNLNAGTKNKVIEKLMVFDLKIQENHDKNACKNMMFFVRVFQSLLGAFGRGFGRSLGPKILQKSMPNLPNTVGNGASASFGWHQAAKIQYLIDFQWFGAQS